MRILRTKNALRNMRASFFYKIVTLLGPFLVRTVFIRTLGAEYLGVNSLFASILSVLSLTELGFGGAIVFNMYKAIANDDTETINALLFFYKKAYYMIGGIIAGVGLLLIPFLQYLINGSYPTDINLILVYVIFLGNSVLSYFMYAYLGALLYAFQRNDVSTKISIYTSIVMYVIQFVILLTIKNYYIYIFVMPVFTIISNLRTAIIVKKLFPQYTPSGKISMELKNDIKERVSGLVIQKICQTSRNSFDSIFISMFLGLTDIAVYNNYYYIMNAVIGIMSIVTSSILAGAGNSIVTETKEKNHNDMMKLNFVYMWIAGWCTVCMVCLFQQFMELWVGTKLLLPMSSMILVCVYFYALKMGDIRYMYNEAAGLWWKNRYRAVLEALANILLNYFLGKYFGINGILLATILTIIFINFWYGSQIIYKYYFTGIKINQYYISNILFIIITFIACAITFCTCKFLPNTIIGFLGKIFICMLLPNVIYFAIYRSTTIYKMAIPWMLKRLNINEKFIIWKLLVK